MVATVVNITSASSGDRYYLVDGFGSGPGAPDGDGPHDSRPDYYTRADDEHRKASHWRGAGAAALKLRGHIGPDAFRQVLQGYVPGTDIRLGRMRDGAHEHRPGVDITLSAPKSVSLEALLPGRGNAARAPRPQRGGAGNARLHRDAASEDPAVGPHPRALGAGECAVPGGGDLPPRGRAATTTRNSIRTA